ncbi:MAG: NAD-dependent dehydratase [Gammaproteobacteria bacterium RIFCSPHIGHO2_12_FULL_36_30]|nr:MAG: NAD-dependent dehydratase [Gammaproteobacteria bacterium RIFCSPHIGHO2_12_FULL_36_30]
MQITKQKIFITGADGFIGSHLVEHLVNLGCKVKAFVFYNSFGTWGWLDSLSSEIKNNIEVVMGDIRDPHGVKTAMQGCDIVLHLAALIGIPYSYHSPDTYVDTNIKGTLNIVQAARELNISKVVHTSTSEVYGTARYVPIDEAHPLQGQSPYSASKIGADQIAMSFYNSFGVPVSIIRPFNTFGPRQSARAFIPTVISQIANQSTKIKLGTLHPTRDFTFVTDTAKAFVAVAESENSVGEIMNVGSNFEISMGDTVKMIAELMNVDIEIIEDIQRIRPTKSEVERLWADNNKIKRLTDWKPEYSGIEGFQRGLQKTIEWFLHQENKKLYKSTVYNV